MGEATVISGGERLTPFQTRVFWALYDKYLKGGLSQQQALKAARAAVVDPR